MLICASQPPARHQHHTARPRIRASIRPRMLLTTVQNKQLSCRRETSRFFLSLNISLSHSRSLKVIRNGTIRKLGHGFVSYSPSIVTVNLSCINSEIKQDIGGKWRLFHTPLHSTPPLGGFPSQYCHTVLC